MLIYYFIYFKLCINYVSHGFFFFASATAQERKESWFIGMSGDTWSWSVLRDRLPAGCSNLSLWQRAFPVELVSVLLREHPSKASALLSFRPRCYFCFSLLKGKLLQKCSNLFLLQQKVIFPAPLPREPPSIGNCFFWLFCSTLREYLSKGSALCRWKRIFT